jgi:hypothetical protein
VAPIKLTNHGFLLSLQPRKHKLSQQSSSSCVKIFSAFFYIVHTIYLPIQPDMCQQPTHTHNSVTIDIQVFIFPNIFRKTLKVFKTFKVLLKLFLCF